MTAAMGSQRSRWHWLADLLDRPAVAGIAVNDALCRLGWSDESLIEGIAAVLDLTPPRLLAPDAAAAARVDPKRLAAIIPPLVAHERPRLRRIGRDWLSRPEVLYQLPPTLVEAWMSSTGAITNLLSPRIDDEGLALLGRDALARLADDADDAAVREAARRWVARFA